MPDFSTDCIEYVLKKEGYMSNNKKDPGGLTIWGVSEKFFPEHIFKMKNMDREDSRQYAKNFYYLTFWTPSGLWRLKHKSLCMKIMSLMVLLGVRKSIKFLQEGCNLLGSNLTIDGDLGPSTADFINSYKYSKAIEEAFEMKVSQYAVSRPHAADFIAGWLIRIDEDAL